MLNRNLDGYEAGLRVRFFEVLFLFFNLENL